MSLAPSTPVKGSSSPAKSPLNSPKHKLTLPELSRARTGLRSALVKSLEAALNRLDVIWTDIGLGEEQKCTRTKTVFELMQSMLDEMATEEEACRTKLRDSLQEHLEDYAKYCTELNITMIPLDEASTLLEKEQTVRGKCGELAKEKHARLKKLKGLIAEEGQLCISLCRGTSLPANSDGPCPSLQQLDEWKQTVDILAREQKRRLKDLVDTRKRLENLWCELETGPSDDFEVEFTSKSMDKMQLTDTTQSRAEQLCADCEKQLAGRNQVADGLRSRLCPLWDRLKVEESERAQFLVQHQGCRQATLQSLRDEVDRLEEIRRLNISSFVLSVRAELNLLWDQCQFGPQQQRNFWPAFTDDFSEELLEQHEMELERLKAYASDNNTLYQLVERRDKLWQRLKEILDNANNPDRLSNRGGRLLKEEKLRKQLNKDLPKVEREVQIAVQQWESLHEEPFLINDVRYLDAIDEQRDHFEQKKEAEKAKRQQVKKAKADQEAKFGSRAVTPVKRKCTAPSAAGPSVGAGANKRKVVAMVSAPVGRKPLGSSNHQSAMASASTFKMATPRTPVKSGMPPPVYGLSVGGRENVAVDSTYVCNSLPTQRTPHA